MAGSIRWNFTDGHLQEGWYLQLGGFFWWKKSSTFRKSLVKIKSDLAESTYLTSLGGLCWHGAPRNRTSPWLRLKNHPNTWCVYIYIYYINIHTSNIRYNTYVARQFQARFLNMQFFVVFTRHFWVDTGALTKHGLSPSFTLKTSRENLLERSSFRGKKMVPPWN